MITPLVGFPFFRPLNRSPADHMSQEHQHQPLLAFQMIVVSVSQALDRLGAASLAATQLQQAYFEVLLIRLGGKRAQHLEWATVLRSFEHIEEKGVYALRKEMRRHELISAIGILDSCLADVLRFLLLHEPQCTPAKSRRKRHGETTEDYVNELVRRQFASIWSRLEFLSERFGIHVGPEAKEVLARLASLRNEIAHHSGFYRFHLAPINDLVWAEKKLVPDVSHEDALQAQMVVREVCGLLLTSMCRRLFGVEPQVSLITAEIEIAHRGIRQQWAVAKAEPRQHIDEFPNPNWMVKQGNKLSWVSDANDSFMITPTGLDIMPVMISYLPNKLHGAIARARVDDHDEVEIETFNAPSLLDQMLRGGTVLVEYFDERSDGPRYARFSPHGFADSWEEACRRTPKVTLKEEE